MFPSTYSINYLYTYQWALCHNSHSKSSNSFLSSIHPTNPPALFPFPFSKNGRRCPQIPASRPQVLPPPSAAPQPGHVAVRARVHIHDVAESEGSPAAGGEANHAREAEHRCGEAEGNGDAVCELFFSLFLLFLLLSWIFEVISVISLEYRPRYCLLYPPTYLPIYLSIDLLYPPPQKPLSNLSPPFSPEPLNPPPLPLHHPAHSLREPARGIHARAPH